MLLPELVTAVAKKTGTTQKDIKLVLEGFVEVIYETLAKGEEVKIVNLGEFEIRERESRTAENPKTKEKITTKPKSVVKFNISRNLKEFLNK